MTGWETLNLVLKKMLEYFLKIQENIRISILKRRLRNLYKKENFKLEIEAMTENLQFYHLDNKQARSAKLRANIRWELQGKKMLQNLLQSTSKAESAKSNNI